MLTSDFDNMRMGIPSADDLLRERFEKSWGSIDLQLLASWPIKSPDSYFGKEKICPDCLKPYSGNNCPYGPCRNIRRLLYG